MNWNLDMKSGKSRKRSKIESRFGVCTRIEFRFRFESGKRSKSSAVLSNLNQISILVPYSDSKLDESFLIKYRI